MLAAARRFICAVVEARAHWYLPHIALTSATAIARADSFVQVKRHDRTGQPPDK